MTTRDALRSALLGSKAKFRSEMVVFEGQTFECRQPSISKRSKIFKAAGASTTIKGGKAPDKTEVDIAKLQMHAVAECVFIPGTEETVFGTADFEALASLPTGGLFEQLADKVMALMNIDTEEIEKN